MWSAQTRREIQRTFKQLLIRMDKDKEKLLEFLQDSDCLIPLSKWTSHLNIFDVLKSARAEIRHSNLLSWLLDPNENHGLGDAFLYGIISILSRDIDKNDALRILTSDLYSFNVYREWNHVDMLLVSNQNKIVIAIENKVGSHEHSSGASDVSQLVFYKENIQSRFADFTKLFVFLTPEGEGPTDDDWMILTYADVVDVLENIREAKRHMIELEVLMLINNYIDIIKKEIIMDQELIELCNKIYNKHRRALDLIFENRDDVVSQVSNNFKNILREAPMVFLDDSSKSKSYVKFRTVGLNKLFEGIDPKYYYYQLEIKEDHITVMLEYHKNRYEPLDDEISNRMEHVREKFGCKRNSPQGNWVFYRVWTEKTEKMDDESWLRDKIQKILKSDGSTTLTEV